MIDLQECYDYAAGFSKKEIKEMGIVYTPPNIIDAINQRVLQLWKAKHHAPPRVVDFSCGTGLFLIDMVEKISRTWGMPELGAMTYVRGCDTDHGAVDIAAKYLPNSDLQVGDGLDYPLDDVDIIVGNPPYIRIQNLSKSARNKIENLEWTDSDYDIYLAFYERALRSGAIVGFVSPNSWLHTRAGLAMREYLFSNRDITELIDFRDKRIFKKIDAYCSILITSKQARDFYLFKTSLEDAGETIAYGERSSNNLPFYEKEVSFLKDVENRSTSLFDVCDIKVGLATLADSVFLLKGCHLN